MTDIKVFVDINEDIEDKVLICKSNADKLGVQDGSFVEVVNPENNKKKDAKVEISDVILDFAAGVSKNIVNVLEFTGVELVIRPSGAELTSSPLQEPTSLPQSPQIPKTQPVLQPQPIPRPLPAPQPKSMTSPAPLPPPSLTPLPSRPELLSLPTTPPDIDSLPEKPFIEPKEPVDPYPNRIDINILQREKKGLIIIPKIDDHIEGGRIQLNHSNLQKLGLGRGMLIGWEDPLTRAKGSARIDEVDIGNNEIKMSKDTKEDTNIFAEQIIVYSTEPPIETASELMLEVESRPNLVGYCFLSPRNQLSLSIQKDDAIAFEDMLTGAIGASKVEILEDIPDDVILIDSEILEASGIGSFEVKVSKNQRSIIPLQTVSLGISPITGDNLWEVMSAARKSIDALKSWLKNYVIFKGIKLRWSELNVACSIIDCVPDLTGDILAQVTENTTITLSPVGLIPFNAILIIDISRSMMARDVLVTNIAPAIEGIKAAMGSREIQDFLKLFKDGINIPRRISAAFAAVLFLSEKVGRGFGEKVAVVRFADEAQVLPLGDGFYMDSASGKKDILEDAARIIVDQIGNSYGQATNMHLAMHTAYQILEDFAKVNPDSPSMIILLTDGIPTDKGKFIDEMKKVAENVNVITYIIGLGNPDRELMAHAAALCGGEYFEPKDAGELLIWYSKRARDLTMKLKAHKK